MKACPSLIIKSVKLTAVFPATVTDRGPVVAAAGTVVVILVGVLLTTVATAPLNATRLLAATGLKFVPVMVTVLPTGPRFGVKLAIVGI